MALQTDPRVFSADALADDSLFDDEEPAPRAGTGRPTSSGQGPRTARATSPRRERQTSSRVRIPDPDAEAIEIATRIVEKVQVAKSLVRIFGSLAREHVGVAANVLRTYADEKMVEVVEREAGLRDVARAVGGAHFDRAKRFARAAAGAAKHAAEAAAARATERAESALAGDDAAAGEAGGDGGATDDAH